MRKINESKLIKDYLTFSFDIKILAKEYAKKHNVSLAKSLDYVTDKLDNYSL